MEQRIAPLHRTADLAERQRPGDFCGVRAAGELAQFAARRVDAVEQGRVALHRHPRDVHDALARAAVRPAVKQAAVHLRAGHALLTFPAGQIEPDPLIYPGAPEALQGWTDSAGVFLRFAPDTRIVPVLVSGVLWERAVKFPLTKFKRDREDREKLGAAFQLLAHVLFNARPLRVRVEFARPVTVAEVGSVGVAAIHKVVIERMRALVQGPPQGQAVEVNWQVA